MSYKYTDPDNIQNILAHIFNQCHTSERAARARRVPKCQVRYFPNSGKGKSKMYLLPQNWKIIVWVGRISKFHTGAGIKQNQLSLPFPRTTKMNILGHHYFAQKHPETSQIKFKQNGSHNSSEDQPHPENGRGEHRGCKGWQFGGGGQTGGGKTPENGRRKNPSSLLKP